MAGFFKILKNKPIVIVIMLILLSLLTYSVIAQTDSPGDSEREEAQPVPLETDRDVTYIPLYHFAGVLSKSGSQGTAILCTNIDPLRTTLIQVKLYNYDNALIDTALVSVNPLRTVTFESTSIAIYIADVAMSSPDIEQGYGLISAEHKSVVCTVQVMDAAHNPPLWMESLPVYGQGSCCSFLPVILN